MLAFDDTFDAMYAQSGRPWVPPKTLLKAVRSEQAFCERLNYEMLFEWFLDLPIDATSFDGVNVLEEPSSPSGIEHRRRVLRSRRPQGEASPLHLRTRLPAWMIPRITSRSLLPT